MFLHKLHCCPIQIYVWIGCNSAKLGHLYAAAATRPVDTLSLLTFISAVFQVLANFPLSEFYVKCFGKEGKMREFVENGGFQIYIHSALVLIFHVCIFYEFCLSNLISASFEVFSWTSLGALEPFYYDSLDFFVGLFLCSLGFAPSSNVILNFSTLITRLCFF